MQPTFSPGPRQWPGEKTSIDKMEEGRRSQVRMTLMVWAAVVLQWNYTEGSTQATASESLNFSIVRIKDCNHPYDVGIESNRASSRSGERFFGICTYRPSRFDKESGLKIRTGVQGGGDFSTARAGSLERIDVDNLD